MANQVGKPVTGNKGFVVAYDATDESYFILHNAAYTIECSTAQSNFVPSYAGGFEVGLYKGQAVGVTLSMFDDEPSSIESNALVENRSYKLYCKRGNLAITDGTSAVWDIVKWTVFKGLKKNNPTSQGIARRVELLFDRGAYLPLRSADSDADGAGLLSYLEAIGAYTPPSPPP